MIVLAIVLLLLVGVVAYLNIAEMVMIDLYFTSFNIPVWLLIVGTLLIGMVIAGLLASSVIARNKKVLKDKEEEMDRAEAERKESVDKVKQDAETQIELQKKEAEIQRLNAKLSQDQSGNRAVPVKETKVEVPEDNHTWVEAREEDHQTRTKKKPR